MTALTGTVPLVRFALRRDRVRMAVWVVSIVFLVAITTISVKGLYPTQADLDEAAAVSEGNAAAIAFNGPAQGLDTVGGQIAFQTGSFGLVVVALMSLLMTGRLTRGEEEAGRAEMLRSLPVGADATTAAALTTVAGMNIAIGGLVTVTLLAQDLPEAGAINFGLSFTLLGIFFAGIALVAAQVTENGRVVYGISGVVLGAAFVVRALGDIGDGALSWLSPIGWVQKARPFAGERWWPFLLVVVATVALLATARAFSARRDLGGGLVAARRGPAVASPGLGRPLGLAVRLQRGSVVGWCIGLAGIGTAYGSIADSIDDFVGENEALQEMLARMGGASLTDAYLATSVNILALVATGFAIASALRLRSEETSMRAEPVLATPVSRRRWAASHLVVTFGGSVIVLVAGGMAVGVTYGLAGGGIGAAPRVWGAALASVPAVWVVVGAAFALVGVAPRAAIASWAFLGGCFVIGMLGALLGLPGWVLAASPFEHVPQLPAADFTVVPLLALTLVAAGLTALGLAGLQRRDIG